MTTTKRVVPRDPRAQRAIRVLPAPLVPQATQVRPVHQDHTGRRVLMDHREHQVQADHPVIKGLLVYMAHRAPTVHQVLTGHRAPLAQQAT